MRPSRRGAGLVALAAATALVLSACGGGGGGGGSVGDVAGGTPPQAGNDINPVAYDQVRDGGDFFWAISSLPPQYNYNQLDGTEADTADVMNSMMPQIMTVIQLRFGGAERARALSAYTAVLSSGFVAGQVLGGLLVSAIAALAIGASAAIVNFFAEAGDKVR